MIIGSHNMWSNQYKREQKLGYFDPPVLTCSLTVKTRVWVHNPYVLPIDVSLDGNNADEEFISRRFECELALGATVPVCFKVVDSVTDITLASSKFRYNCLQRTKYSQRIQLILLKQNLNLLKQWWLSQIFFQTNSLGFRFIFICNSILYHSSNHPNWK